MSICLFINETHYLCRQWCTLCEAGETVCGGLHIAVDQLTARPQRSHTTRHPSRTHGIKHFCKHTH